LLDGISWSAMRSWCFDKDVIRTRSISSVAGVYQFRVGIKRSGSTITSADLAFRKDGVSV
jgi:hypothetical protein